jgi:ATP-dependent exoDNAse (exonuclease V) beta subunit
MQVRAQSRTHIHTHTCAQSQGKRLPANLEEETRLAYVGCTRAKQYLYFVGPNPQVRELVSASQVSLRV